MLSITNLLVASRTWSTTVDLQGEVIPLLTRFIGTLLDAGQTGACCEEKEGDEEEKEKQE